MEMFPQLDNAHTNICFLLLTNVLVRSSLLAERVRVFMATHAVYSVAVVDCLGVRVHLRLSRSGRGSGIGVCRGRGWGIGRVVVGRWGGKAVGWGLRLRRLMRLRVGVAIGLGRVGLLAVPGCDHCGGVHVVGAPRGCWVGAGVGRRR